MYTWILVFLLCSWKKETKKISKVIDYAALNRLHIIKYKYVWKGYPLEAKTAPKNWK